MLQSFIVVIKFKFSNMNKFHKLIVGPYQTFRVHFKITLLKIM